MGIDPLTEFFALGSTTYTGNDGSKKEADASWINALIRPKHDDWLVSVIEVS